jgi:hypothetical protein
VFEGITFTAGLIYHLSPKMLSKTRSLLHSIYFWSTSTRRKLGFYYRRSH